MHDRMRKIMLEAGYAAPELASRAHKLIELLIRECANECDPEPGLKYSPNSLSSRMDCKNKILRMLDGQEQT